MEPEETTQQLRKRVERATRHEQLARMRLDCVRAVSLRDKAGERNMDDDDDTEHNVIIHQSNVQFRETIRHEKLAIEAVKTLRNLRMHLYYMLTLEAMPPSQQQQPWVSNGPAVTRSVPDGAYGE